MTTSNEHNNAPAQEQCNACCGTGRMVRDPDIGTDQECFVCDGTGFLPAQYKDSTPQLSVGESSFESWFESYNPANKGDKQRSRDAYAAGMGDPLVAAAPAQGEPFGYFRPEPFGWTDCAEDDEGAIALYERPQELGLTDEEIKHVCAGIYLSDHPQGSASYDIALARAIIAALRAKGQS